MFIPDSSVRRLSSTAARSSRILDGRASALSTITGMFRVRGSSRRRRNTSYNEYEYVGFGLRSDDSRDRAEEALEVLTRDRGRVGSIEGVGGPAPLGLA